MDTRERLLAIRRYQAEISEIKRELAKLPEGTLVIRGQKYYIKDGASERGVTKDLQLIRLCARKEYLSRRLCILEWNHSMLQKIAPRLMSEDPEEIISGLSTACRSLPREYFFHPATQRMEERPVSGNSKYQDSLNYLSYSGVRVRSKSEQAIANLLDQYKIPYHYEAELVVGGESWRPDFTIVRPSDGKTVIWEHFGMMDDKEYRDKAKKKLNHYIDHGLYPLVNLICSFERDMHDFTRITQLIEMMLI